MKKVFLAICIAAISSVSYGQKGTNAIGIGVDLGLPMGDFGDIAKFGFGGYAKFLYGIGEAGQLTLTTGYTTYKGKDEIAEALGWDKITYSIIPVLVGYRHNFSGFYVEPQVGYASFGSKIKSDDFSGSGSNGGFAYGVGVGFAKSGFDIGARYQGSSVNSTNIAIIGVHIGYNISLGGEK
jgi:hypothetical protein